MFYLGVSRNDKESWRDLHVQNRMLFMERMPSFFLLFLTEPVNTIRAL